MDAGLWALLLGASAIVLGSVLQRVSGLGVGLVVGPVLAMIFGPALGILVTNVVATISGFFLMIAVRRNVRWKYYFVICGAALIGVVPGAFLVRELSASWLQVIVGTVVLLSVLMTAVTAALPVVKGTGAMVTAGAIGGLSNVTAGVAGPVLVVYSRLSRWDHIEFAATMQPVFMTLGALSVGVKSLIGATGDSGFPPWWYIPAAAGLVVVGAGLGSVISRSVSASRARTLAIVIAGLGAVAVLARGVASLL